ncbi:MAG: hypothetical protein M1838_003423 [Thelocarpon superellum]|nr:MAG: hypothetical protein M1838_003423 [Thelocarpon superellum]
MAEALLELLEPHLKTPPSTSSSPLLRPAINDGTTARYLAHLSTLSSSALTSEEPQKLQQASHASLLSLQALSARSHRSIVLASDHLATLRETLPALARETEHLQHAIPDMAQQAERFSQTYSRLADNVLLDRRRKALLLARNADRLADILELPSLLSSAISASSVSPSITPSTASATMTPAANYASALDLEAHIKRLHVLYPASPLIDAISRQAEEAMRGMTSSLIASLRAPGIKLAGGMRTVGWLRRVAPELDEGRGVGATHGHHGSLGALFLVCRLANLGAMLDALEPLRELADQETRKRRQNTTKGKADGAPSASGTWSGGQQTERYLKRYIEIFREQSFAIISMYQSIFPSTPSPAHGATPSTATDPLQPLPSALATFPLHLLGLLTDTLRQYLPNVQDRASRESLLTQVLYCAGSLGRLGGDFSLILALLEPHDEAGSVEPGEDGGDDPEEWIEVMKKHRVLAGRLELLASGIGPGAGTADALAKKPPLVQ